MIVIPAVDIKSGKCVRLTRGRMDEAVVYFDRPVEAAVMWQKQGATRLHVVDLDGAVAGLPVNYKVVTEIVEAVDIPVQVGGGIRDMDTLLRYFDAGIDRVVLGTSVVYNRDFFMAALREFGERIIVGIDAINGNVSVKGWVEQSSISALDLAQKVERMGASRIIYTDIARDGTLAGPNLKALDLIARAIGMKLIASGGISSIDDIRNITSIGCNNIEAVIVGKALYNGSLDLKDALALGG